MVGMKSCSMAVSRNVLWNSSSQNRRASRGRPEPRRTSSLSGMGRLRPPSSSNSSPCRCAIWASTSATAFWHWHGANAAHDRLRFWCPDSCLSRRASISRRCRGDDDLAFEQASWAETGGHAVSENWEMVQKAVEDTEDDPRLYTKAGIPRTSRSIFSSRKRAMTPCSRI
jgi:hypothetical protein